MNSNTVVTRVNPLRHELRVGFAGMSILILGILLLSNVGVSPATAAVQATLTTSLVPSNASQMTLEGVIGASVTFNNTLSTSETVLIFGSVLNQEGQVISYSFQGSTIASGSSIAYFFSIPVGVQGNFHVIVFATTTSFIPLSNSISVAVTA